MKEVKPSPHFETSVGATFTDKERAASHEELITAKSDYETAKRIYSKLIWNTQKTADGQPFDLGSWHTYYLWCLDCRWRHQPIRG